MKKSSFGYSLIELLIAIVIIGILSAIALPSFLSQTTKARASEAKINLSIINRSQQAYYLEYQKFANDINTLNLGIVNTENYNYKVHLIANTDGKITGAIADASKIDLNSFAALVEVKKKDEFKSVICESDNQFDVNSLERIAMNNLRCRKEGKKLGK